MQVTPKFIYCHWEVFPNIVYWNNDPISGRIISLLNSLFNHYVNPIITNGCTFGSPGYIWEEGRSVFMESTLYFISKYKLA